MPPKRGGRSGIGCQVLCFNKRCQRPEKEDALCLLPPSSQRHPLQDAFLRCWFPSHCLLRRLPSSSVKQAAACWPRWWAPVVSSAMRWCWSSCSTRRCSPCFRLLRCIRRPIRLTAALPRACLRKQARLMGLSLLCKKDRDLALGVGYGIGHGGVEAALLAGVNAAVNAAVMLGAPPRRR